MKSRSAARVASAPQIVDDCLIRKSHNPRLKRLSSLLFLTFAIALSSLIFDAPVVARAETKTAFYVCPMDRDVKATKPGKCPKCGMALRRDRGEPAVDIAKLDAATTGAAGSINLSRIPDTIVYDQDGRRLSFYNDLVKGKTVAINFLFTNCTTICPPLAATFRKVQQQLGDRVGRRVFDFDQRGPRHRRT